MPSPGPLHTGSGHLGASHQSATASAAAAAAAAAAANASPHWQQQLLKAEISRQSASPHHHARAAALAARSATSAAVAIQDPNKGMHIPVTAANGLSLHNARKDASHDDSSSSGLGSAANGEASSSARQNNDAESKEGHQSWTTIDMGGLGLKNLANELFRYDFLTSLFVNHNNLTTLSPEISRLKNLVILDASSNKLTSLPPELGILTSLKELFLFDNGIVTLPPELGSLHNLDTLGIEGNPLADNLLHLAQSEGTSALIAFLRDSCPVPLPPPEREWITIEPDLPPPRDNDDEEPDPPPESFNVLCYNILCEKYATQQLYGYTPSWALAWDYRKDFILQEVMSYGADIVCLQEVDSEQYEDYFLHHLSQQDYDGIYWPKSRARTMRDEEKRRVDGCATFFKSNKFALIEKQLIEFNQIALQRPDFRKTEDMFNRVMTKDNIAIVALLENRDSGSRFIVANVHNYWDHEFRDVKLVQVAMLMDELEKIGQRFAKFPAKLDVKDGYPPAPKYSDGTKIPTLICGDFNSVPKSGVYDFLDKGVIAGDHEDFMKHIYGDYTAHGLQHKLALKSAYHDIGELPFTNYTPNFVGSIDYIWYNSNALAVTGLLGEVDRSYLNKVVGFPNAHFPSDHICILSEFRVKYPRDTSRPKVGFGGPVNGRDRDRNQDRDRDRDRGKDTK
ncbi:hypothetical protein L7F22_042380 [Adiantum nelumboides]|nr:hypothetical protein [Adiantum nelumboides]